MGEDLALVCVSCAWVGTVPKIFRAIDSSEWTVIASQPPTYFHQVRTERNSDGIISRPCGPCVSRAVAEEVGGADLDTLDAHVTGALTRCYGVDRGSAIGHAYARKLLERARKVVGAPQRAALEWAWCIPRGARPRSIRHRTPVVPSVSSTESIALCGRRARWERVAVAAPVGELGLRCRLCVRAARGGT